jgi:hypothetical protein
MHFFTRSGAIETRLAEPRNGGGKGLSEGRHRLDPHHGAEFTAIEIAVLALLVGVATRCFPRGRASRTRLPCLLVGIAIGLVVKRFETGGGHEPWFMVVGHGAEISHHLIIFVFSPRCFSRARIPSTFRSSRTTSAQSWFSRPLQWC